MKEYIRTRHSVYLLTYHMVFVTKWRKPVITDEIGILWSQQQNAYAMATVES